MKKKKEPLKLWEDHTAKYLTSEDAENLQRFIEHFQKSENIGVKYYSSELSYIVGYRDNQKQKIGEMAKIVSSKYDMLIMSGSKGYYRSTNIEDKYNYIRSWCARPNASIYRVNSQLCKELKIDYHIHPYMDAEEFISMIKNRRNSNQSSEIL